MHLPVAVPELEVAREVQTLPELQIGVDNRRHEVCRESSRKHDNKVGRGERVQSLQERSGQNHSSKNKKDGTRREGRAAHHRLVDASLRVDRETSARAILA